MTAGVAVALYNGQPFIRDQLDCLRRQTKAPDQVVLCDDGSTDGTVRIVTDYIQEYGLGDKWFLRRNEQNLGYIRNFYRAMSLLQTDVIFLSDQDDVWDEHKIEKMTAMMEQRPEILLLSCKYGIIDAEGSRIHSIMERQDRETGRLRQISVSDIMRAYLWPGMLMAVKREFFLSIEEGVNASNAPHDMMLAVNAADRGGFYEYGYVGAFHRRHDHNTAREEHRVRKLLNIQRKLTDIAELEGHLSALCRAETDMSPETRRTVERRLKLLQGREQALRSRSISRLMGVYRGDGGEMLRVFSLLCDLWLICFGSYRHIEVP